MAILKIIKYEGDNQTFIWKHPVEDFNTKSQLIVDESQEAIFYMNGQALDLFGPGRHTLETQNIPLIRKLVSLPTGGETAFKCKVYFINKTEQMAIKWGTDSKVQFLEPTYKFPLSIGASGQMSMVAENSRKLIVKLVGTEAMLGQDRLVAYFRAFIMTRVKTYLAQIIKEKKISIFEVDEHLNDLSEALKQKISADFADYGITLKTFFVTTVVRPEGEANYEKFKSLYFRQFGDVAEAELRQKVGVIDQKTEAEKMVIESEGMAQKRKIEGYNYQQERGFDVAEKVAQNEGSGNFTSAGIGLGIMSGVGGAVGSGVGGAFNDAMKPVAEGGETKSSETDDGKNSEDTAPTLFCDNCGTKISRGASFCEECGQALEKPKETSCKGCGHTFEKKGKFCPKCGTKRES